jgi:hypothetical protein
MSKFIQNLVKPIVNYDAFPSSAFIEHVFKVAIILIIFAQMKIKFKINGKC